MQKFYYNRMQHAHVLPFATALLLAVATIPGPSPAFPPRQSPAKPLTTSSLDSHDGLTIAADPWLSADRYKTTFPKKSPFGAGVLAIKITIRNDSSDSIRIGLERIRLNLIYDENNRQELPALSSEELADSVLHPKLKGGTKPRLPIPLPTSPGGRDKNWQEYKRLAEDAGLHANVVAPHKTVEGLLYFDMQNQFDLLSNARLYFPDLLALEKDRSLMYFDIDLSHPPAH